MFLFSNRNVWQKVCITYQKSFPSSLEPFANCQHSKKRLSNSPQTLTNMFLFSNKNEKKNSDHNLSNKLPFKLGTIQKLQTVNTSRKSLSTSICPTETRGKYSDHNPAKKLSLKFRSIHKLQTVNTRHSPQTRTNMFLFSNRNVWQEVCTTYQQSVLSSLEPFANCKLPTGLLGAPGMCSGKNKLRSEGQPF